MRLPHWPTPWVHGDYRRELRVMRSWLQSPVTLTFVLGRRKEVTYYTGAENLGLQSPPGLLWEALLNGCCRRLPLLNPTNPDYV